VALDSYVRVEEWRH